MSESIQIDKWLYSLLSQDSVLIALGNQGVDNSIIPNGAKFPRIVFNLQAGKDTNAHGGKRVLVSDLYQIKEVSRSGSREIVKRLDFLVQNRSNEVFSGYVFTSRREQEINYSDGDFRYLGGLYRVYCSKL